jgi:hypothetical protein
MVLVWGWGLVGFLVVWWGWDWKRFGLLGLGVGGDFGNCCEWLAWVLTSLLISNEEEELGAWFGGEAAPWARCFALAQQGGLKSACRLKACATIGVF